MRCRACGAANPDHARWCGQCFTSFEEEPAAPAVQATAKTPGGAFRRRGDEIEWQCPRCEAYTSIDALACRVCGTSLAARYDTAEEEPVGSWSAAVALSVVVPGSGHLAVGRYGSGSARLVLFTVWLVGGLLLSASGGRGALPAAAPLYLGAFVLWAGSIIDLLQLQRGGREVLAGRTLLWLVVGVVVLSMVGMFAAAGGALRTGR